MGLTLLDENCLYYRKQTTAESHKFEHHFFRNYGIFRRRLAVLNFFTIIYCKNTNDFFNSDFSKKNLIFCRDLSVLIKEIAFKIPFQIQSPN